MKILISWSGKQSLAVAKALREWVPLVVPHAEPWMSNRDVSPGSKWFDEVMRQLESTDFCVICLTPDNMRSPWLYFEAGAIAAKHKDAKVCGYLTGISPSQIGPGPFTQFQCVQSDKSGTLSLVRGINQSVKEPIKEEFIDDQFSIKWPRLREQLKEALLLYDPRDSISEIETVQPKSEYKLLAESRRLLIEAASDRNGTILMSRTMHGLMVQTNDKQLCDRLDARSEAKWQAAVRELVQHSLIESRGPKGELFGVTSEGYRVADELISTENETA
jgi:hypothetical protein